MPQESWLVHLSERYQIENHCLEYPLVYALGPGMVNVKGSLGFYPSRYCAWKHVCSLLLWAQFPKWHSRGPATFLWGWFISGSGRSLIVVGTRVQIHFRMLFVEVPPDWRCCHLARVFGSMRHLKQLVFHSALYLHVRSCVDNAHKPFVDIAHMCALSK